MNSCKSCLANMEYAEVFWFNYIPFADASDAQEIIAIMYFKNSNFMRKNVSIKH
jgi:hypothetical protein